MTDNTDTGFNNCAAAVARILRERGEEPARKAADAYERSVGWDAGKLMWTARELNAA